MPNSINNSQSSSNGNQVSYVSPSRKSNSSKKRAAASVQASKSKKANKINNSSRHLDRSEKMSDSRDTTKSKNSRSAYSVSISKKGAKASRSESKQSKPASKQSYEKVSRTAHLELGKALQKFRNGTDEQTQFTRKTTGAGDNESKGLLSAIKEMYSKQFSGSGNDDGKAKAAETDPQNIQKPEKADGHTTVSGKEISKPVESNGQIVINGADVSKPSESNGQIVNKAPQKAGKNLGIAKMENKENGPPVSPLAQSGVTGSESSALLSTVGLTDIAAQGPLGGVMANMLKVDIQIKNPVDKTKENDDDDHEDDKKVESLAPGLAKKDDATVGNQGVSPVNGEDKKAEKEDENDEKGPPLIALKKMITKNQGSKPVNIPPGQIKKAEDNSEKRAAKDLNGFGQLKKLDLETLNEVEELLSSGLQLNQGIKAYQQHALNAEPAARQGFKGTVRMNTDQGTPRTIASGAVIHMNGKENGQIQVNSSVEMNQTDFRSMIAQTPVGKNAALSIYRGVQNYVG